MVVCAVCGEENPERARFLRLNCAAPLTSESTARVEERKVVLGAVLSTWWGSRRSRSPPTPRTSTQLLRGYHRDVRHEIERYGGTVEKFIGDAVVAVFGAPVAHEDDPERAVRAALRILDAVP